VCSSDLINDYPGAVVDQQYLPDTLADAVFYNPSDHGREGSLVEQWRLRNNRAQNEPPVE